MSVTIADDDIYYAEHVTPSGIVISLEEAGIAWTVTVQHPHQERWRASTFTAWPMRGGPAGLPANRAGCYNVRCDDPRDTAEVCYAAMVVEYELAEQVEHCEATRHGVLLMAT